jgi:hypothetical protein
MAQRALVALERREHDPALARLVAMLEEVLRHTASLPPPTRADIGRTARSRTLTLSILTTLSCVAPGPRTSVEKTDSNAHFHG